MIQCGKRRGNKKRIAHAKLRASERYGIELTDSTLGQIESYIKRGKAEFVKSDERGPSPAFLYRVSFAGKTLLAVATKKGKVVTFLPPNCIQCKDSE